LTTKYPPGSRGHSPKFKGKMKEYERKKQEEISGSKTNV
jgi:hypothetical protein